MAARCEIDPLDTAVEVCDHCGGRFCGDHLVWPGGRNRPPLCKPCAVGASGVRSTAARGRRRPPRQVKRRRQQLQSELQADRAAGPAGDPGLGHLTDSAPASADDALPEHLERAWPALPRRPVPTSVPRPAPEPVPVSEHPSRPVPVVATPAQHPAPVAPSAPPMLARPDAAGPGTGGPYRATAPRPLGSSAEVGPRPTEPAWPEPGGDDRR
jgi:hypothetical protein